MKKGKFSSKGGKWKGEKNRKIVESSIIILVLGEILHEDFIKMRLCRKNVWPVFLPDCQFALLSFFSPRLKHGSICLSGVSDVKVPLMVWVVKVKDHPCPFSIWDLLGGTYFFRIICPFLLSPLIYSLWRILIKWVRKQYWSLKACSMQQSFHVMLPTLEI